jgi:hypothetical protein
VVWWYPETLEDSTKNGAPQGYREVTSPYYFDNCLGCNWWCDARDFYWQRFSAVLQSSAGVA